MLVDKLVDLLVVVFVEKYLQYCLWLVVWYEYIVGDLEDLVELQVKVDKYLVKCGYYGCCYVEGMWYQLCVVGMWLVMQFKGVCECVVQQFLKYVVVYEVGYVLGLWYNFKVSLIYDLDEIKKC